jgi:hypothetical protein
MARGIVAAGSAYSAGVAATVLGLTGIFAPGVAP